MITGITTTFLTSKSSKTGKNIAVLEIDEASLSRICDYIQPSLFVITNIFRDQMDRYGEIYTTYNMILDAIRKVPTATVLLNGDSPLFYKPAIPNPVQYFGFVLDAFGGASAPIAAHDDELDVLSAREQEVMRLIARGYPYKEVASELFISIKTVETHVSAVLRKLQLSNRNELTHWAMQRHII